MPYPFLFGTYSPLRAITNAPANMAMTKEIIPAAALDFFRQQAVPDDAASFFLLFK